MLTKVHSVVHSPAHFQVQEPLGIFLTDMFGVFLNGECSEVFLGLPLCSLFFCQGTSTIGSSIYETSG